MSLMILIDIILIKKAVIWLVCNFGPNVTFRKDVDTIFACYGD